MLQYRRTQRYGSIVLLVLVILGTLSCMFYSWYVKEVRISSINILLDVVNADPGASDDELVEALVNRGLAQLEAERLVAFVPMACRQAVLANRGARFPPTYIVRDLDSGYEARGWLAREPVFRAAQSFVKKHGVSSDAVWSLAERSAEVNVVRRMAKTNAVVNAALRGQGDLADIYFTEDILTRLPVDSVRDRWWWQR